MNKQQRAMEKELMRLYKQERSFLENACLSNVAKRAKAASQSKSSGVSTIMKSLVPKR